MADHTHTDPQTHHSSKPLIVVVLAVCAIFIISLFTFQVQETEHAVVTRWGNPVRVAAPGLHFKLPTPVETVWRKDRRVRCFDGNIGELEETFTRDGKNIVIGVYVCWRIQNSEEQIMKYLRSVQEMDQTRDSFAVAEELLTNVLRSTRSGVISRYDFGDLINVNATKVKIDQIEADLLAGMQTHSLDQFGIEIVDVGLKQIGLPEKVSISVFERMKAEREATRQEILARGDAEAQRIRAEAESQRRIVVAQAEASAKKVRGAADAAAAEFYDVFNQEPELAEFLAEVEALKKLSHGATLFFDPDTPPFSALKRFQDSTSRPGTKLPAVRN